MVADVLVLAPYGLPGFIEGGGLFALQCEAVHEVGLLEPFGSMLVAGQFQTEVRGADDLASLIGDAIDRPPLLYLEVQRDAAVRRLHFCCCRSERQQQG